MSAAVPVSIRWKKEVIAIPDLLAFKTGLELKKHLESITGVQSDRQTITGIGKGILKDADAINAATPLKKIIHMLGSSDKIPEKPKEEIVFIEDVVNEEDAYMAEYPPGLTNLGNTCYMNSAIQVIRRIPEIRESLAKLKGSSSHTGKAVAALRDLYHAMDSNVGGQEITPTAFVNAFRQAFPLFNTAEETPFGKIYSQQDAEEFLNILRTTIQTELGGENHDISKLFVGAMQTTFTNQETDEEPLVIEEDFHSLKCFISKETKHLLEGLQEGLRGSVEKHSAKLDKNATFSKQSALTELPPYLMINFVRFFWKEKEQIQNKIIKKVKFPLKLDVAPLCSESLKESISKTRKARIRKEQKDSDKKRAELTKEARELKEKEEEERAKRQGKEYKRPENNDDKMEIDDVDEEDINGPNGDYELFGIITHKGREISSGHYVGWVKDNDRWLAFDDDKVGEVSENDILELAGGGDRDIAYITLWRKLN